MNKEEITKELSAKGANFWIRSIVVAIIFSITAFLIMLDAFKEYKSSVSILVLAKGNISSVQIEDIVSNVSEFPKMLSFYDRLLKFNSSLKDEYSGKSKDERKALWNKNVEVSRGDSNEGSIIKLSVFSDSSSQAESLLKLTSRNLFEVSSMYYDAEKEVALSIVDGPYTSAVSRNTGFLMIMSLMLGIALSFLLNVFLNIFERNIGSVDLRKKVFPKFSYKKEEELPTTESKVEEKYVYDMPYNFDELKKEKSDEMEKEHENEQESQIGKMALKENSYPNYPEMPKGPVKHALAPENLPIADDFVLPSAKKDEDKDEDKDEGSVFMEMKKNEPTAEELRERLNKLLRGEM